MEVFYPAHRFLNLYVVPLRLVDVDSAETGQDPESGHVGHAMIVRDITEDRRSTQTTIESERLYALTMLAAGVAHEIGNPLNSLTIHLQLMERKLRKLPPDQRGDLDECVRVAQDEIRRLDFIVSHFCARSGPARCETQPGRRQRRARGKRVASSTPKSPTATSSSNSNSTRTCPPLELDRDQMKQAFYNVIRNSFQAMKTRRHPARRRRRWNPIMWR